MNSKHTVTRVSGYDSQVIVTILPFAAACAMLGLDVEMSETIAYREVALPIEGPALQRNHHGAGGEVLYSLAMTYHNRGFVQASGRAVSIVELPSGKLIAVVFD